MGINWFADKRRHLLLNRFGSQGIRSRHLYKLRHGRRAPSALPRLQVAPQPLPVGLVVCWVLEIYDPLNPDAVVFLGKGDASVSAC